MYLRNYKAKMSLLLPFSFFFDPLKKDLTILLPDEVKIHIYLVKKDFSFFYNFPKLISFKYFSLYPLPNSPKFCFFLSNSVMDLAKL